MAKIVITAALFLAMVAMASAYTTITTTVVEEENTRSRRGGSEMCQQQFMEQQRLNMCKMYLQQARPYAEEDIEMVANPMRGDEEGLRRQCCSQLGNMHEECRCQNLRTMAMERQQSRRQMGRQMGDMARMAMELPRMCNMEPREC